MNEKYMFGLVVIAATIFVTFSMANNLLAASSGDSGTSLTYHTSVCIYKNGELIGPCSHNLVTDIGKEHLEQCLGAGACGAPTAFTNMTLANCTNGVQASDTTLCNGQDWTACDLGPADTTDGPTYVSAGTGAWNITASWTANSGCSDLYVNATGLYNNTHLFAENNFTSVTLQGGDSINVTWGIWIT
jgi:hypothetical protein